MNTTLPPTQWAVELTGPDQLRLNRAKPVTSPGPHQILLRIDAVGICFSDLKLLKQFDRHPRKTEILAGAEPDWLRTLPSYCPGDAPTVPGHEVVGTIAAIGEHVRLHRAGERVLVQTDYRWLKTASSNGAFGYNIEGGLQQYVLLDERVIVDPDTGQSFLLPVADALSDSAAALIEPWACVECSYITAERRGPLAGGRLLVVVEPGHAPAGLGGLYPGAGPASATLVSSDPSHVALLRDAGLTAESAPTLDVAGAAFDDIIVFGARRETIEPLGDLLATGGIINLVLAGAALGAPVAVDIGRIHYQGTRWIGTPGAEAAPAYDTIPATGEVREGDDVLVLGAGGPMGQMHVIRLACSGTPGLSITGTDLDAARLATLNAKLRPLPGALPVRLGTSGEVATGRAFSYIAVMVPVGALVAEAVAASRPGALINIFAGIPVGSRHPLDLDRLVANRCFMFGTSGSRLEDMFVCLDKAQSGRLETNASVDAISGLAGAIDGIRAVENRTMGGKIVVYPALRELGLVPLADLPARFPTVAALLDGGLWNRRAEAELLRVAAGASA